MTIVLIARQLSGISLDLKVRRMALQTVAQCWRLRLIYAKRSWHSSGHALAESSEPHVEVE